MNSTFKNQVIWITGASSGYGKALAYALIQAGARVVLSARNVDQLNHIHQQHPQNTAVLPLDLSQPSMFAEKTTQAIAAFGHIDMIIHNGALAQNGTALETRPQVAREIMEVDYFSYTELTQYLLPHLIKRRKGHIVVISGLLARLTLPGRSSYAAAKSALHGYFGCLRQEIAMHDIAVTILIPGAMQTELTAKALKADGSITGGPPSNSGMPVDIAARLSLQAIAQKANEVVIGDDNSQTMWRLASQDPVKAIKALISHSKQNETKGG